MTITESTQLLSKGASVKLLADMLKQAEEEKRDLLEALKHPTYGNLFDLATEINDALEEGTAPRIGQIGALFDMGRRQREALEAAKSDSIDPDYENAEAQREAN